MQVRLHHYREQRLVHPAPALEVAVEQCYKTLAFSADFIAAMKHGLEQTVNEITTSDREVRQQVEQTLTKLRAKEERLVGLAMEGTLPSEVISRRLVDIRAERQRAEAQQVSIAEDVKVGAANIALALGFLAQPYEMYRQADEETKKQFNAAIFERLYVHIDRVTDVDLRPGLRELKDLERQVRASVAVGAVGDAVAVAEGEEDHPACSVTASASMAIRAT